MRQREQQSHVAIDAFLLQRFRGANSLPGRSDLDQNAFAANPIFLIKRDKVFGFGDDSLNIKRLLCGCLSGNSPRHNLQNLQAKCDQQPIENVFDQSFARKARLLSIGDDFLHQVAVLRHLGGFENESRIGGGILGPEFLDCRKIARVCHNPRKPFQLVQLTDIGRGGFPLQFDGLTHMNGACPGAPDFATPDLSTCEF